MESHSSEKLPFLKFKISYLSGKVSFKSIFRQFFLFFDYLCFSICFSDYQFLFDSLATSCWFSTVITAEVILTFWKQNWMAPFSTSEINHYLRLRFSRTAYTSLSCFTITVVLWLLSPTDFRQLVIAQVSGLRVRTPELSVGDSRFTVIVALERYASLLTFVCRCEYLSFADASSFR